MSALNDMFSFGTLAAGRATQDKWDGRFTTMAEGVSLWSKDPSTKIGAVIVDSLRRVVSVGYNGFPRGMDDSPEIYADREKKLSRVVHAEMNAILNASASVQGATIYLSGLPPCDRCAVHVIQAGIKRVVYQVPADGIPARWATAIENSLSMFREAGVAAVARQL